MALLLELIRNFPTRKHRLTKPKMFYPEHLRFYGLPLNSRPECSLNFWQTASVSDPRRIGSWGRPARQPISGPKTQCFQALCHEVRSLKALGLQTLTGLNSQLCSREPKSLSSKQSNTNPGNPNTCSGKLAFLSLRVVQGTHFIFKKDCASVSKAAFFQNF